jgi:hypothetical protein
MGADVVIEIMPCARCNVFDKPENLSGMLIHPDGRNEPHTEGPYCDECVEARKGEIDDPGAIRSVQKLRRIEE